MICASHDTLEQIWGWSQFGGAILALVALVFAGVSIYLATRAAREAKTSADAARRTAEAADRTAAAAEEEARISRELLSMAKAEAAKRPRFEVTTRLTRLPRQADRPMLVLTVECQNVGDRHAIGAVINVNVPPGVVVEPCDDARGNGARRHPMHETLVPLTADGPPMDAWLVDVMLDLRIQTPTVRTFRLTLPGPGSYPVRIVVGHGELTDGNIVRFATAAHP